MKLLYLTDSRLPTEKAHGYQIAKMCEAFAQSGAEVLLLHPYRYQSNPQLRERSVFDYYGVPLVFEVRTLPNFDVVLAQRFLPKRVFTWIVSMRALLWGFFAALMVRKEKADLYFTRKVEIAFWLVRMGLPTVFEVHVMPQRWRRWLLRQIAHRPSLRFMVVLTSFIRERLMGLGFSPDKISVFPDAVDLTLFEGLPDRKECRRRLELPLDRSIIGYIGRFHTMEKEKGIPELIEALADLSAFDGWESLLLCVGGPMDAVPGYLELAHRLGIPQRRLRFVDRVPNVEVPLWIRACDVVTIPWPWTEFSAYFTSPLKLFEYMASGTPIVATDLPSIREILQDGENAVLVEPDSPEALAKGIQHVLKMPDRGQRLADQAQCDVAALTWERRAANILAFADAN